MQNNSANINMSLPEFLEQATQHKLTHLEKEFISLYKNRNKPGGSQKDRIVVIEIESGQQVNKKITDLITKVLIWGLCAKDDFVGSLFTQDFAYFSSNIAENLKKYEHFISNTAFLGEFEKINLNIGNRGKALFSVDKLKSFFVGDTACVPKIMSSSFTTDYISFYISDDRDKKHVKEVLQAMIVDENFILVEFRVVNT